MHESRDSDTAVIVVVALLGFILLAGGGAALVWQRQRTQVARAEEVRARAVVAQLRAVEVQEERAHDPADDPDSIAAAIRQVLQAQQEAWNAGDIDQFMEHYWRSDDLTFSSSGKLTRSWTATLENYKVRYPSRSDMGTLDFQDLEVRSLGTEAALVLGNWHLSREAGDVGGNFSVIFQRVDGKWVIIHDHTSRAEQP
jgi:beta-aspartyl-peptidase (threonine type)